MARNKTAQGGISLRRKVTAWLAAILLVTMLSTGIATMAGQWTVRSFDMLLADNAVCYTVQNALKDETQAFARYVRQPTSETEQAYTAACTASEQSLAALPFDYARIGEERYARTWNLLQGYAGYRQERDAFLQLSPSADTYIEQMYHVMALQDYLAEYALRLTQATLEQENALYSSTAAHIRHLPWLYLGLFLMAAVLMLLLIRVLSRAVVRPLLRLAQASRSIAEGDFSSPDLPVKSNDEVGRLTGTFNQMKHAMAQQLTISYAIAVSSLTAILSSIDLNVAVLTAAQRTFVGMSKFSLTAIPFFILAGNIMNQGGIAKRLVDFVMAILGKMPGALLVTNIGTNALFGAISGSASAAAAAVGSMIRDGAEEQGYDPAVTAATNAASSCSGLLIPPSNALITYSLASGGTSVAALFMAGYIPGIIWALCCCVVGVLLAVKLGYKGTPGKFDWKNLGICTLRALPSLSLIIVVIGGIIGGVFSATEGSAIAVAYALILAFCYRSINLKSLWKIIVDSAKMSGMVVFLVGVSNILGWVMAFLQIPDAVAAALLSLTSNKYIILLIMNVILLVSGTFMDVTPAILIFTPLFLPICQSFGMSTIQFGLILVYNLCIGNITPPVGNALFVGIKVGRTSLSKVMPYMLMYYVAIIGGLLLVTFIPAVSTALPQAMGLM